MPASAVSSPTATTRTRTDESVATVPATTRSPGSRPTAFDSPVIIDSSNAAEPVSIVPSAGTRPPGRTNTRSPGRRSAMATSLVPAPSTRSAMSGSSAASASRALDACPMAFISCQCPSSITSISSTSSHQKSRSSQLGVAREARPERHRDREGDEEHHAGRAVAQFLPPTLEERRPAVDEHRGAERERDPLLGRHARRRVAEQVLQHLRPDEHRHAQQQAQPEPVAEHRHAVPRVLVVTAVPIVRVVSTMPASPARRVVRPCAIRGVRGSASVYPHPELGPVGDRYIPPGGICQHRVAARDAGSPGGCPGFRWIGGRARAQPTALMISSLSWVNCCRWATRSLLSRSTIGAYSSPRPCRS